MERAFGRAYFLGRILPSDSIRRKNPLDKRKRNDILRNATTTLSAFFMNQGGNLPLIGLRRLIHIKSRLSLQTIRRPLMERAFGRA